MRLQGKVALITGGNSGIGLATAKLFVQEGAKVAITGRNAETLEAAGKQLGSDALVFNCEVTDEKGMNAAVQTLCKRFGDITTVFANAGIAKPTALGGTELSLFDEVLRINVTGAFAAVQACVPLMKRGGSVIFNSSIHALSGSPFFAAYAASKGALAAMARTLAAELAPSGLRVNAVLPGATRTPIWKIRTPEAMTQMEAVAQSVIPLGKIIESEDIAQAVLFLASDEARMITGQQLVVDGGHVGAAGGAAIFRPA